MNNVTLKVIKRDSDFGVSTTVSEVSYSKALEIINAYRGEDDYESCVSYEFYINGKRV